MTAWRAPSSAKLTDSSGINWWWRATDQFPSMADVSIALDQKIFSSHGVSLDESIQRFGQRPNFSYGPLPNYLLQIALREGEGTGEGRTFPLPFLGGAAFGAAVLPPLLGWGCFPPSPSGWWRFLPCPLVGGAAFRLFLLLLLLLRLGYSCNVKLKITNTV